MRTKMPFSGDTQVCVCVGGGGGGGRGGEEFT